MDDPEQIWQSVLGQIELKYSTSIINTWFNNTSLGRLTESQAVINCQSPYTKEILYKRYQKDIAACLEKIVQRPLSVDFELMEKKDSSTTRTGPLFDQAPEGKAAAPPTKPRSTRNLNPRYTFDNFVVGNCNRVAHAAALATTEQPGRAYNPLFIYGGSGMGKTHLLCAIGNEFIKRDPTSRVLYFPVETFINDFVQAIRFKKTNQFKEKYRQNDCILVDDIQFIGGDKSTIQEEFFHTFNKIHNRGNQIVICSDRPPAEIEQLTNRLVTRFAGGLMVEISPPEYETKLAIIQTKSSELGLELSGEAAEFIAQSAGSSIREIEGLLLRIRSETLVQNLPADLNTLKSIVSHNNGTKEKTEKHPLTPETIFKLVNERFGTSMADLCGKNRKREVVVPRQIAMYLLRNDLGLNFEHIGQLLGGRDHTTIMHGAEKISKKLQKKETPFAPAVRQIRQTLY